MVTESARSRFRFRSGLSELGWGGRTALVVLAAATILAVVLGVQIPNQARHHLLEGRASALRSVADAIVHEDQAGLSTGAIDVESFDQEIRIHLLGGETVGAKVWEEDGTIVYATDPSLIGSVAEVPVPARGAFAGSPSFDVVPGEEHPELNTDSRIIEFFFPITADGATVVFEIEQLGDSLEAEIGQISRTVWTSIVAGLAVLAILVISVLLAGARSADRRRRHAQRVLSQALGAAETERRRIVAALHGDIGQRLYRVLYGLEGLVSRGLQGSDSAAEVERLEQIVRDMEQALRSELRMLHRDAVHDIGFAAAVRELAETTRLEAGIGVVVDDTLPVSSPEVDALLFGAVEEAVINARKHADASRVVIEARRRNGFAEAVVTDDGVGFDVEPGIGLVTLRERLTLASGGLELVEASGGGSVLRAWVPLGEPS